MTMPNEDWSATMPVVADGESIGKPHSSNEAMSESQGGDSTRVPEVSQLASAAVEQSGEVVRETGRQARELMATTRDELVDQAAAQQTKIAEGLMALSDELRSMSTSSTEPGLASDLADQAANRLDTVGTWLDQREPGQLLDEVRQFATKRPGTFLAIALGAGIIAGRVTRSMATPAEHETSPSPVHIADEHHLPQDGSGSVGAEWAAAPAMQHAGGETL